MLKIEIVSGPCLSWCFIGKRRLETAVAIIRETKPDFA